MLTVENLNVHYGQIHALRGVEATVEEGEIVAVLGPNGAGKSSLIRSIVGVQRASDGAVRFKNDELLGCSPESIVRKGVALVPERRRIFSRLTVEENLLLGARVGHPDEPRAALNEIYARFPALEKFAQANAGKLSGGQQQQLAIGRALLCAPRLLLLDEPSLGLAPLVIDDVFRLLDALRGEGLTVVLVEQFARRALELADRAYILNGGVVRAHDKAAALLHEDAFETYYFGGDVS